MWPRRELFCPFSPSSKSFKKIRHSSYSSHLFVADQANFLGKYLCWDFKCREQGIYTFGIRSFSMISIFLTALLPSDGVAVGHQERQLLLAEQSIYVQAFLTCISATLGPTKLSSSLSTFLEWWLTMLLYLKGRQRPILQSMYSEPDISGKPRFEHIIDNAHVQ